MYVDIAKLLAFRILHYSKFRLFRFWQQVQRQHHRVPECQSVQLEGQPWAHLPRVTGWHEVWHHCDITVTSLWHHCDMYHTVVLSHTESYCIYHLPIKSIHVAHMLSFDIFWVFCFMHVRSFLTIATHCLLGSSRTSWPASVMSSPGQLGINF